MPTDDLDAYLDPAPTPRTPRPRKQLKYDEPTALNLISQYESRNQNVPNYRFDPGHTAQGYYQITNTNWRKIAPQVGIDLTQHPSAMSAPRELQAKVAGLMYRNRGFSDWAPFNPALNRAIGRGAQPQQRRGELDNYLDPVAQPTQPTPRPRRVRQQQPTTQPTSRLAGAQVSGETQPQPPESAATIRSGLRGLAALSGSPTQLLPTSAQDWLNEAVAGGVPTLTTTAAGIVRGLPQDPTTPRSQRITEQVANQMNAGARQVGQQVATAQADRGVVSREAQNLVAGGIGSSPAMVLTALGVPAPLAFGAQSYLESTGQDKAFNEVVKDTAKGATIGALFEIPLPAKAGIINAIGQRLTRMGIVGGGTELINQATGASDPKSALVNALFAGAGGAKREASTKVDERLGSVSIAPGGASRVPSPAESMGARPSELEPYLSPVKSARELPPEAIEGIKQARELMRNDIGQFRRKTSDEKAAATPTTPAETPAVAPETKAQSAAIAERGKTIDLDKPIPSDAMRAINRTFNQTVGPDMYSELPENPTGQDVVELLANMGLSDQIIGESVPKLRALGYTRIGDALITEEGLRHLDPAIQKQVESEQAAATQGIRDQIRKQSAAPQPPEPVSNANPPAGLIPPPPSTAPRESPAVSAGVETPTSPAIKTPKLALGVEAKAVERKLTEGFSDLPEYDVMRVREQAKQATDLLDADPERAHRIAMGEESPPKNLRPEAVFTAVENRALERGDVETLQQLASSSSLPTEATAMGQRIRLLGERNPSSAVAAIRDVQAARESKVPALKKSQQAIHSEIKVELRKTAPKARDWASFLESIKCR